MLNGLRKELREVADKEKGVLLQRFFKTGKGEYGEGDIFLGVVVPKQRAIAKKYVNLTLEEIQELLNSKIHEERLTGLIILTLKYKKAKKDNLTKRQIFEFYIKNTSKINNWDLVDLSAPNIVGAWLLNNEKDRKILYKLAKSESLWDKRIAIISTFAFIKDNQFKDTLKISEILLRDKHDLIHKAVGWALREVGKKDKNVLVNFLEKHYKDMPRTMLRYSIEKFPEEERRRFLGR